MAISTVTYSQMANGWTSFWSYIPDWMIGMNNSFYSWYGGNLYKHNTNATRNTFYGTQYPSEITTIFNQEPTTVKIFKTISLNGDNAWDTTLNTDISTGSISKSYYKEKEDQWYAYIRKIEDGLFDARSLSCQGVGTLLSYSTLVLTFSFDIGSSISQGDQVYKNSAGTLVLVGYVASHTKTTITLVSAISAPTAGDFIAYVKNTAAESHGTRGYYMSVTLSLTSNNQEEIFAVNTSVIKSNP